MVVQFEEHFAHQVHRDLVLPFLTEELEEFMQNYQQFAHILEVLCLEDSLDEFEEVVLAEGSGQVHCLLLGDHLKVLIDQNQHHLSLLPLEDPDLITNQRQYLTDQMLILQQFNAQSV